MRFENASETGDVLVFLPARPRFGEPCGLVKVSRSFDRLILLPLYGDLSPEEQDRAVMPADRPKVILSTNLPRARLRLTELPP